MRHPIQRLLYCTPTNRLYACTGDQIQCFDAGTGSLVGKWVAPKPPSHQPKRRGQNPETAREEGRGLEGGGVALGGDGCSPAKKRKAEEPEVAPAPLMQRKAEGATEADIRALEITAGGGAGSVGGQEVGTSGAPGAGGGGNNVSRILSVKDGRYLVVATNEDKTIRVFDSSGIPGFEMLSERTMPKRPCAIAFTGDDDMLLCADKFGDVYAIPLLIGTSSPSSTDGPTAAVSKQPPPASDKGKLAEAKRRRTEISHDLPFSNKLLLGHVSMLTDLAVVSRAPEGGGKARKYILTADRDEHIRVSRYPQGYVIEGFCLGHRSFVSRLLIPSWDKSQLLSGGGDDFLLRWQWEQNRNVETVPIARLIEDVVGKKVVTGKAEEEEGEFKPALIGMWEVPSQRMVIVGFESVSALFSFNCDSSSGLKFLATIRLSGDPLDVAVDPTNNTFWVSLFPPSPDGPMIEHISWKDGGWQNTTASNDPTRKVSEQMSKVEFVGDLKALTEGLLRPTGLLRKGFGKERDE